MSKKITPQDTCVNNPENGIYQSAVISDNSTPCDLMPRQVRLKQLPCMIHNIMEAMCWPPQ